MRNFIIISLTFILNACHQNKIEEIEKEMTQIDQLTSSKEHTEFEEDENTGRIENIRIRYYLDNDSSIRRIVSSLRFGNRHLDTLNELDYYYQNDNIIFISIKETVNQETKKKIVHDCEYYFRDHELIQSICSTGEPKKGKHLIDASRFNLTTVQQLMKN